MWLRKDRFKRTKQLIDSKYSYHRERMDLEEVRGINILPEADDGVIFYVKGSKVSPSTK